MINVIIIIIIIISYYYYYYMDVPGGQRPVSVLPGSSEWVPLPFTFLKSV